MDTDAAVVVDVIENLMKFGRVSERLGAVMISCKNVVEALDRVVQIDDGLQPELLAALRGMEAVLDTVVRAHAVADARYEVELEAIRGRLDEEER